MGRKTKAEDGSYASEHHAAQRAKGLCCRGSCKRKAAKGKTMCAKHLEELRKRNAQRYKAKRQARVCIDCRAPLARKHALVRCAKCNRRENKRKQDHRNKGGDK